MTVNKTTTGFYGFFYMSESFSDKYTCSYEPY